VTATGTVHEMPVEKKERRKNRRYNLSLPARVNGAGQESLRAKSRDVSTGGAYLVFDSNENLTAGTELDLTLTLPKEITSEEDVLVRAHGRAVRVDTYDGSETKTIGIAVVFERHHFIRSGSSTR
jgi:hypothetical protein